ncbi:MAG: hypothetical protein IIY28_08590, partial [Lachnospiraceae bacterium]|nr:hypothetical protein [Lachnospiraceae bacterium]
MRIPLNSTLYRMFLKPSAGIPRMSVSGEIARLLSRTQFRDKGLFFSPEQHLTAATAKTTASSIASGTAEAQRRALLHGTTQFSIPVRINRRRRIYVIPFFETG